MEFDLLQGLVVILAAFSIAWNNLSHGGDHVLAGFVGVAYLEVEHDAGQAGFRGDILDEVTELTKRLVLQKL